MQSNVVRSRVQVDQSIVDSLREVKETVAIQLSGKRRRTFGIPDLWKIHSNAKLAAGRIR